MNLYANKLKKSLALLLAVLMLMTLLPLSALSVSASDEPTIVISCEEEVVNAGDTIEVMVNIEGLENTVGLTGAQIEIGFDPNVFELVTYFDEDEEAWFPQIEVGDKYNVSSNKYILFAPIDEETGFSARCLVQYLRATASETQVRREPLFYTATFRVKDDAISGTYELYVKNHNNKNIVFRQADAVEWTLQSDSITVNGCEPPHVCDFVATETKAPTCGETGIMTYTCACGETYDEEIPATGDHVYDNDCDADCNVCVSLREVPGHDYQISETHPSDCGKDGWMIYTCTICGGSYDEGIPATGDHVYDNDCDNFCNVCGGLRDTDHEWAEATCTAPKTCTKCGAEDGEALGHDWEAATCTAAKTCKVCGETDGEALGHTYKTVTKKATTTANGYTVKQCSVCGNETGKKTLYKVSNITLSKTSFTYNGKVQKPTVTVKKSDGSKLTEGTSYTVKYSSGCKVTGTYKVTVTLKGNYTGTKTLTYKIAAQSVSKCKITLSKTSYTYNGKVQKPTVTVKNAAGSKLTTASYTVTYASGRKNVGEYKVTIKMKGNYTGTKTVTFKIVPAATTISKLTAATKALTVKWAKKTTQVTGYEIQYSTSKSFSSYKTKTVTKNATTSVKLTGLSAKKTYYVRIRTYKTVSGKKIYSGWSTVKSLKTK